jgi:hypothetical protein
LVLSLAMRPAVAVPQRPVQPMGGL